jgi:hypothetical protein
MAHRGALEAARESGLIKEAKIGSTETESHPENPY